MNGGDEGGRAEKSKLDLGDAAVDDEEAVKRLDMGSEWESEWREIGARWECLRGDRRSGWAGKSFSNRSE